MTYNSTYDLSNMDVEYKEHIANCVKETKKMEADAEHANTKYENVSEILASATSLVTGIMSPVRT